MRSVTQPSSKGLKNTTADSSWLIFDSDTLDSNWQLLWGWQGGWHGKKERGHLIDALKNGNIKS